MKKVALITGGTSGIGLATVKKFLESDYHVITVGINKDKFTEVKAQLPHAEEVELVECDISDEESVKQLIANYEYIDVLVNNAGVLSKHVDLVDADMSDIERAIKVDLMGTIYMSKYVAQLMKQQQSGTIINIGSIDGVMANHESVAYHAAKGGVHMFTKALARELSPFGVRIVCVAPGWVDTGMVPESAKEYGSKLMMKHRLISTAELASVIYLMTLPEASAINGSVVMADDGYASFKGLGILDL